MLAKKILNRMEADSPWLTGVHYMEAIGAVCSLYPQEVEKKSVTGRPLRQILLTAASPVKFQWLLNDTRYRHACSTRQLKLLPSGATSNESLHHELNYWFRETQHSPTDLGAEAPIFPFVEAAVAQLRHVPYDPKADDQQRCAASLVGSNVHMDNVFLGEVVQKSAALQRHYVGACRSSISCSETSCFTSYQVAQEAC